MIRAPLFISARIRRISVTIRLTVETSRKHQTTVGMLSLPLNCACQAGSKQTNMKQDSCRTSAASSKSELMMPPVGLVQLTRSGTISAGHCINQTKISSVPLEYIHTPPHACVRGVTETQCSGKALNYLLQEAWPDKRVIVELLPMRSLSIKCLKKKAFIPVSALVRASCM